MKRFATQVVRINGRQVKHAINEYESADVRSMTDAASRAAIEETSNSGDVAIVAVGTPRGTVRTFEVEVTHQVTAKLKRVPNLVRRCRVCGCTDSDCRQCIEKTGTPCHWVEADLCSACVPPEGRGKARS